MPQLLRAAGSDAGAWGLWVSTEKLTSFLSPSQLNRPKVNKIVEVLEKAKSCYWPALQNVYMNVNEGELGTRQELSAPSGVGGGSRGTQPGP